MNKAGLSEIYSRLRKALNLLNDKAWKPASVDERTWRRWLSGKTKPSPQSAKAVALKLWDEFDKPNGARTKDAVFRAIRDVVPDAPCQNWTRDSFAAWFFDLAEKEKRDGNGNQTPAHSATLDLLVWRPDLHDCISVRDPRARPLRAGDGVRVEAHVTGGEAHLYLIWLTLEQSVRQHAPFYPWNGKWQDFDPAKDKPRNELAIPEEPKQTWPLHEPRPSLETVILLTRRQPLAENLRGVIQGDFERVLKSLKGKLNLHNAAFIHESAHPDEPDPGRAGATVAKVPDFGRRLTIGDPVYELTCALRTQFGGHFDFIRTLTVAYAGKEKRR